MVLSREQIEEIAVSVTNEFGTTYRKRRRKHYFDPIDAVPIEKFATDFLGLEILFAPLSIDGSVCGLTTYIDTEYRYELDGKTVILPLKQNQIVLDSRFNQPNQTPSLRARGRFTLAHECAHQLLFHLEEDDVQDACRRQYSERRPYYLRELKTRDDWNEWQANVLGAAILMPRDEIRQVMQDGFGQVYKIVSYGGDFRRGDRWKLNDICKMLEVSMQAAIIRLRDLGYLEEYVPEAYADSWEAVG